MNMSSVVLHCTHYHVNIQSCPESNGSNQGRNLTNEVQRRFKKLEECKIRRLSNEINRQWIGLTPIRLYFNCLLLFSRQVLERNAPIRLTPIESQRPPSSPVRPGALRVYKVKDGPSTLLFFFFSSFFHTFIHSYCCRLSSHFYIYTHYASSYSDLHCRLDSGLYYWFSASGSHPS